MQGSKIVTVKIFVAGCFNKVPTDEILLSTAELYCQIWKEKPWIDIFWDVIGATRELKVYRGKHGGIMAVAYQFEDSPIGFVYGWLSYGEGLNNQVSQEYFPRAQCFYIGNLAVDPLYRRRGIGQKLMQELICRVKERSDGCRFVITLDGGAKPAKSLLSKFRFTDTGLRDPDYGRRTYWVR